MATDPLFHMPIKDVFSIAGRGVVVTGTIDKGTVRLGDEVIVRGGRPGDLKTSVSAIESGKKMIPEAKAGDTVGILMAGLKRPDVETGFELLSPDMQVQ